MINSSLWVMKPLLHQNTTLSPKLSWDNLEQYMSEVNLGHPTEKESEFCLVALLRSCGYDWYCDVIMKSERFSTGYRATHK